MNAQTESAPDDTEKTENLTDIQSVSKGLIEFDRTAAGLAALQEKYGNIVFPDIQTTAGLAAAKLARAEVKEPRLAIERLREGLKRPLLELGRRIDKRAKEVTAEILKLEEPIDAQIKTEEARREAEKEAKVQAELARVKGIQDRIQSIRDSVVRAANKSSADTELILFGIRDIVIDDSFAEFRQTADDARVAAMARLVEMLDAAKIREEDARRTAAALAELERLKAEKVQRDREDDERRQRERDEERRRAEAQAREEAERQRQENERRAAEQRARDEREKREREDREHWERQQAEARAENDRRAREIEEREAAFAAREAAANAPKVEHPLDPVPEFAAPPIADTVDFGGPEVDREPVARTFINLPPAEIAGCIIAAVMAFYTDLTPDDVLAAIRSVDWSAVNARMKPTRY